MNGIHKRLLIAGSVLVIISLACDFSLSDTGFMEPAAQRDTEEASFNSFVQTEDALCAGLSEEECANQGTHFYDITRNPRPSTECNYNDWPASREPRKITFQDNLAFVSNYGEDYSGHSRVAQNIFAWINPADGVTHTITFSQEGYTETTDSSPCGWEIVNTISE